MKVECKVCEANVGTRIFLLYALIYLVIYEGQVVIVGFIYCDNIWSESGCLLWNVLLRAGNKNSLIANNDLPNGYLKGRTDVIELF